ncbi:deoxynucleoside monophosphate kinase [Carp edema virus]|nr:deoxynucleoside monophosphate kinase [Carp edema virus]
MEPIKITFCGKATSGKDTAFKLLEKHFRTCRYAFATHLKKTTAILFDLDFKYFGDDLKDKKLPTMDFTPRDLLIGIGSKAREYVPTIFADYVYSQLEREAEFNKQNYDFVTVTDARYKNEANNFRKLGFIIVRIVRDSAPKGTHISERDLDDYDVDKVITNNGSLEEFEDKILALAIELREKRRRMYAANAKKISVSTKEDVEEKEDDSVSKPVKSIKPDPKFDSQSETKTEKSPVKAGLKVVVKSEPKSENKSESSNAKPVETNEDKSVQEEVKVESTPEVKTEVEEETKEVTKEDSSDEDEEPKVVAKVETPVEAKPKEMKREIKKVSKSKVSDSDSDSSEEEEVVSKRKRSDRKVSTPKSSSKKM